VVFEIMGTVGESISINNFSYYIMITEVKILEGFESAHEDHLGGNLKGYHLDAFEVGQVLDIDSNLVVLIGNNGSGKSTFLKKLRGQEMQCIFGKPKTPYFELTYRGKSHYLPFWYNEKEQPIELGGFAELSMEMVRGKYTPEEKILGTYSSGQYSVNRMLTWLEEHKEKGPGQTLIFDQPEDGVSIFRRQALVDTFSNYAFENDIQLIIATHEPNFLGVKGAKIINLEDKPAQVYDGGIFDITPYMKPLSSLKEGLF
jgi:predicted ATPase